SWRFRGEITARAGSTGDGPRDVGDACRGTSTGTGDASFMTTIDTLRGRWAEFAELPLPEGLDVIDAGVDVELLVSTASDCIETYLATGLLSPRENGALRACSIELKRILPQVEGEAADY